MKGQTIAYNGIVSPRWQQRLLVLALSVVFFFCLSTLLLTEIPLLTLFLGMSSVFLGEYAVERWGTEVSFKTERLPETAHRTDIDRALSSIDEQSLQPLRIEIGDTATPGSFIWYTGAGPTLVVTDGLLTLLEVDELKAVLVHEGTHLREYHPQQYLVGRVTALLSGFTTYWTLVLPSLTGGTGTVGVVVFVLLWLGGGNPLLAWIRYALGGGTEPLVKGLVTALSRTNEYIADGAVKNAGLQQALVSALEKMERSAEDRSETTDSKNHKRTAFTTGFFRSHPPLQSRIDRLSDG